MVFFCGFLFVCLSGVFGGGGLTFGKPVVRKLKWGVEISFYLSCVLFGMAVGMAFGVGGLRSVVSMQTSSISAVHTFRSVVSLGLLGVGASPL